MSGRVYKFLDAGGSLFSCSELPPTISFLLKSSGVLGRFFFLFKLKCSPFLCSEAICCELLALVVPDALTLVHSYLQLPSVPKKYEHKQLKRYQDR